MTSKITVYSDFHTPQKQDGEKITVRPSRLDYTGSPEAVVFTGDGTQSKRRPEGYTKEDAAKELIRTLTEFAEGDQPSYSIPGNHDMAGDFNETGATGEFYTSNNAEDPSVSFKGSDLYSQIVDQIEGIEDIEGRNIDLDDTVIVAGYNHEEPEFPRYADDVKVPAICDVNQDEYITMEKAGDDYAAEKLVNEVIKDISDRYNMPADEAIEDEVIGDLVTEDEREFIENISNYADKKLNLIERLERVEDACKTAILPSHAAPNGKRSNSEIDEIKAPIPGVRGKNYGSVIVEEVASNFEDTVEAIIGGHVHEGSEVHEKGSVEYFGDIPVINPGFGGMVEIQLDDEGLLEGLTLYNVKGLQQDLDF